MALTQDQVVAALRQVKDPELHKDIVLLNRVKQMQIDGNTVRVRIDAGGSNSQAVVSVDRQVREVLKAAGVADVDVEFINGPGGGGGAGGGPPRQSSLPQIKKVIAVGAGKGGVGKSTLALNLAIGLRRAGLHVGLMDGDIYGPSMPTMLGIKGLQPQVHGGKILPFSVHGIHAITIGALVEVDKPLIWRGPMAHGAFKQLLVDNTEWPPLDYLIVDLPPGTGDVPLTLCQLLPLTGAMIVATPQQVALDDAVRAVKMFEQLQTPVLGLVENMSYVPMPDGTELDLFGRGGTEKAAQSLGLPFLGAVPMYPELRKNSDAGTPGKNFEGNPGLRIALEGVVTNLQNEVARRSTDAVPTLTIS
jgi:ATP-binding protein involved in chromosome partitioning